MQREYEDEREKLFHNEMALSLLYPEWPTHRRFTQYKVVHYDIAYLMWIFQPIRPECYV